MLECYTVLKNTWNNFSTHAAVDPNHTLKPSHHNSVSRRWPLFLLIHVCFWSLGCLLLHNHKTVVWHVHMNIHFLPHVQFVYFWGALCLYCIKAKIPKRERKVVREVMLCSKGPGPVLFCSLITWCQVSYQGRPQFVFFEVDILLPHKHSSRCYCSVCIDVSFGFHIIFLHWFTGGHQPL